MDNKTLQLKDYIIMGVLTIIYAIIAFYHLGSTKVPETYWKPAEINESFYADLGSSRSIDRIYYYAGIGDGKYRIDISNDNINYKYAADIEQDSIYVWKYLKVNLKARYIKFTVENPGAMLNEIVFFNKDYKILPVRSLKSISSTIETSGKIDNLFDEQNTAVYTPSFMDGMYFDEIYHARTAFENINRIEPYETTHPPLGKLIISVGILLFGMNPFGWRIAGTVFGIAFIPIMYIFGKKLFKETRYAFLTAFLMAFDFMHFTQTRIATIDTYGVFFIMLMYYYMYKYATLDYKNTEFKKTLLPLGLCGLFFGLGAASKWICLYSGAGLAIIFFYVFIKRCKDEKNIKKAVETISYCILFFILVPSVIYLLSYIPFMMVSGAGHGIKDVINCQVNMYKYHTGLKATHPFASPWYEWPIIKMPIWYYEGEGLPAGKISSIVSMGNPAIWWTGAVALILTLIYGIHKKDKKAYFLLIGFASQYLPWILVPRLTFIYHYFASVPFIIFCIVYMAKYYYGERKWNWVIYAYMSAVVILFIMFYPVLSGMTVSKGYVATYLRWFDSWYFYN